MNCPLCRDQKLKPFLHGQIEADMCSHCHGVWLDREELEKLQAPPVKQTPTIHAGSAYGQSATNRQKSQWELEQERELQKEQRRTGYSDLGETLWDIFD